MSMILQESLLNHVATALWCLCRRMLPPQTNSGDPRKRPVSMSLIEVNAIAKDSV